MSPGHAFVGPILDEKHEVITVLQIEAEDTGRLEVDFVALRLSDLDPFGQLAESGKGDTLIGTDDAEIVIAEISIAHQLDGLPLEVDEDGCLRARRRRQKLVKDVTKRQMESAGRVTLLRGPAPRSECRRV